MKYLLLLVIFIASSYSVRAQLTVAWTGQNGNLIANNAGGGVYLHHYEGSNIMSEGGQENGIEDNFLSIENSKLEPATFLVYPNPTNNSLNINLPTNSVVEIYSIQGVLLMTVTSGSIDVSELPEGTYFISSPGYKNQMIIKL